MRLLVPSQYADILTRERLLQKAREVSDLPLQEFRFMAEYQEAVYAYVADVFRSIMDGVARKFGVDPETIRKASVRVPVLTLVKAMEQDVWEMDPLAKALLEQLPLTGKDLKAIYGKFGIMGKGSVKPLRIAGKTLTNPKTGKLLTGSEWKHIEDSIVSHYREHLDGLNDEIALRCSLLALLRQSMGVEKVPVETQQVMGWDDLQGRYGKAEFPRSIKAAKQYHRFDPVMVEATKYAAKRAGEFLSIKDGKLKQRIVASVRNIVEGSIEDGADAGKLAARLYRQDPDDVLGSKYKDNLETMQRDWRRVAITETSFAINNGFLSAVLQDSDGEPAYVVYTGRPYAPEGSGGCNQFIGSIYRIVGGPTRGQKMDDRIGIERDDYASGVVWPGKNNVGRKMRDWWAAIPTHPHCRHWWEEIYPDTERYDQRTMKVLPKVATKSFTMAKSTDYTKLDVAITVSDATLTEKQDKVGELEALTDVERECKAHGIKTRRIAVRDRSPEEILSDLKKNPPDLVVNLHEWIEKKNIKSVSTCGVLDLLGIPYTGNDHFALSTATDKGLTKMILRGAGVPTADWYLVQPGEEPPTHKLGYPCIVKPNATENSFGIDKGAVVKNGGELSKRIKKIHREFEDAALVEKFLDGRELNCPIYEDTKGELHTLPLVEVKFSGDTKMQTWDSKFKKGSKEHEQSNYVVAKVGKKLEAEVQSIARRCFRLLRCRDYMRVDIRTDKDEHPFVLEVNPNSDISWDAMGKNLKAGGFKNVWEFLEPMLRRALARKREKGMTKSVASEKKLAKRAGKTLCFDFDGVIHSSTVTEKGPGHVSGKPVKGIKSLIGRLRSKGYTVVVQSARCRTPEGMKGTRDALKRWGIEVDDVVVRKPIAQVYIDDRAVRFDGDAGKLAEDIERNKKSWMEKSKRVRVPASAKHKAYTRMDPRTKQEKKESVGALEVGLPEVTQASRVEGGKLQPPVLLPAGTKVRIVSLAANGEFLIDYTGKPKNAQIGIRSTWQLRDAIGEEAFKKLKRALLRSPSQQDVRAAQRETDLEEEREVSFEKSKLVRVPASAKRKAYTRMDPRTKKAVAGKTFTQSVVSFKDYTKKMGGPPPASDEWERDVKLGWQKDAPTQKATYPTKPLTPTADPRVFILNEDVGVSRYYGSDTSDHVVVLSGSRIVFQGVDPIKGVRVSVEGDAKSQERAFVFPIEHLLNPSLVVEARAKLDAWHRKDPDMRARRREEEKLSRESADHAGEEDTEKSFEKSFEKSKHKRNPAADKESEKIRENRKVWGGKEHRFKPAKWTHPNGHPRCIRCGMEESTGGVCKPGTLQKTSAVTAKCLHLVLRKALPGLVKKKVTVRGKTKQFMAFRWHRLGEVKAAEKKAPKGEGSPADSMSVEDILKQEPDVLKTAKLAGSPSELMGRGAIMAKAPEVRTRLENDYDFAFEVWKAGDPQRVKVPSPAELLKMFPKLKPVVARAKESRAAYATMMFFEKVGHKYDEAAEREKPGTGWDEAKRIRELIASWSTPIPDSPGYTRTVPTMDYEYGQQVRKLASAGKEATHTVSAEETPHLANYKLSGRTISKKEKVELDEALSHIAKIVPGGDEWAKEKGLSLEVVGLGKRAYTGQYNERYESITKVTRWITVDPKFSDALTHEFGHFLDHTKGLASGFVEAAKKLPFWDDYIAGLETFGSDLWPETEEQRESYKALLRYKKVMYRKQEERGEMSYGALWRSSDLQKVFAEADDAKWKELLGALKDAPEMQTGDLDRLSAIRTEGQKRIGWGWNLASTRQQKNHSQYLVRDVEVFARMFEQYVSMKSGGQASKAFEAYPSLCKQTRQLPDAEFKQVAPIMKRVIEEKFGKDFVKSLHVVFRRFAKSKMVRVSASAKRKAYTRMDPRTKKVNGKSAWKKQWAEWEELKKTPEKITTEKWVSMLGGKKLSSNFFVTKTGTMLPLPEGTEHSEVQWSYLRPGTFPNPVRIRSTYKGMDTSFQMAVTIPEDEGITNEQVKAVLEEAGRLRKQVIAVGGVSANGMTHNQWLEGSTNVFNLADADAAQKMFDLFQRHGSTLKSVGDILDLLKAAPGLVKKPVTVRAKGKTFQSHRWVRQGEEPAKGKPAAKMTPEAFAKMVVEQAEVRMGEKRPPEIVKSLLRLATATSGNAAVFLNNALAVVKHFEFSGTVLANFMDGDVYPIIDKALAGGQSLAGFRKQAAELLGIPGAHKEWDLSIREYATMRDPSSSEEDIWYAAAGAWGSSTNKEAAILLQEAVRDELLGGKGFIWQVKDLASKDEAVEGLKRQIAESEDAIRRFTHSYVVADENGDEEKKRFADEATRAERKSIAEKSTLLAQYISRSGRTRAYETPEVNIQKLRSVVRKKYEETQKSFEGVLDVAGASYPEIRSRVLGLYQGKSSKALLGIQETLDEFLDVLQEQYDDEARSMTLPLEEIEGRLRPSFHSQPSQLRKIMQAIKSPVKRPKLPLYRGVKNAVTAHNVAESWTEDEGKAEDFDGHAVLKEEVPVERVLCYYGSDSKLAANDKEYHEAEYIVLSDVPKLGKRKP